MTGPGAGGEPRSGRPGAARKRGRISRSAEFDRAYRQGRSFANRYLVVYAFPRGDGGGARLGVSVSRKVGGAVERNKIKRVLREAFAQHEPGLPADVDVVVVARQDVSGLAERDGVAGVAEALGELLGKATAPAG